MLPLAMAWDQPRDQPRDRDLRREQRWINFRNGAGEWMWRTREDAILAYRERLRVDAEEDEAGLGMEHRWLNMQRWYGPGGVLEVRILSMELFIVVFPRVSPQYCSHYCWLSGWHASC